MKKALFITSFIIFTLAEGVSYAGQYKLVRGSQFELCREFEKNLNSFKAEPPMVCERKINPRFTDFRKPNWKQVDAKKYINILEQLIRYTQRHRTEEQFQQAWGRLNKQIDSGQVTLQMSYFDLDHNGRKEPVMKLTGLGCNPIKHMNFLRPVEPHIFVVTENKKELDMRFQRVFGLSFDEFTFRGRAYISKWSGIAKKMIGIYEPYNVRNQMGIQNRPICQYDFID